MAVEYGSYIYNHLPNKNGIAPADLFTGTQVPRHKLKDLHVWGAPVYVLDPTLQQGRKIPRWEPRARRGIFVGFSQVHSSDIPLVLNTRTGHISPQYHVVFDDTFSTVESIGTNDEPPPFWDQLELNESLYSTHVHRIHLDPDDNTTLAPEWLTPAELESRSRQQVRDINVRGSYVAPNQVPTATPTSTIDPTVVLPNEVTPVNLSDPASSAIPTAPTPPSPANVDPLPPRRSTRTTKSPTLYVPTFLASIDPSGHQSSHSAALAYAGELQTDINTGEVHCTDPRAYVAKTKVHDPDQPSYHEAMTGDTAAQYITAMKKEIRDLITVNTSTTIEEGGQRKY